MYYRQLVPSLRLWGLAWLLALGAGRTWADPPAAAAFAADGSLRAHYADAAGQIIERALREDGAWKKLEELCDDIGHRLSGSAGLEKAVNWAADTLRRDGHENVRLEKVMVPKWVRGHESLRMLSPQEVEIPMLGLGGSVGTPSDGITAEVLSVRDEDDLHARGEQVRGKIVLFDVPMSRENEETGAGYGPAVRYRGAGARMAAEYGAVAALVRSVTTRSLQSPHTGAMNYAGAKDAIPSAAISVEFATRISRLQERGIPVRVTLKMEARTEGMAPSANVIGELRGCELPDEVVVIGGHIDSWDVGQGAHDDGGGCIISMSALTLLRQLGLTPRRTIRVVLFTNEENGLAGGTAYAETHAAEMPNHVAAIESDSGIFAPRGYGASVQSSDAAGRKPCSEEQAVSQLAEICTLLAPLGDLQASSGGGGADIGPMRTFGVPMIGQQVDMTRYFDYHHTHADTIDKIDPLHLKQNVAALALTAYILADMPMRFAETP